MKPRYGKYIVWIFLVTLGGFSLLGFGAAVAALFGYIDWTKGGFGIVTGAGAALGIKKIRPICLESLRRELLPDDAIGKLEEQLKDYFRNRLATVPGVDEIKDNKVLTAVSQRLMLHFLHFLEAILRTRAPGVTFEISVFANVHEPEIICYYDSGGSAKPSSATSRDANPQFYREQKYEAVELLDNPSGGRDVIVISRTDQTAAYSFRNKKQKERIKSTCLCSFVDPEPMVIVLVANQSGIFDETDAPLKNLVSAALMSVAYERNICKAIKMPADAPAASPIGV